MRTIEIKNRYTGAVLFRTEVEDTDERPVRTAVTRAIAADADLAGANLADANLADANLAGAYLAGADLADADLADANLAHANLADADLAGANLADANLADAYLAGADLADANLADANLADANLAGANLAGANLADARNLPSRFVATDPPEPYERAIAATDSDRARRYRDRHPEVPVVDQLDARILAAVTTGGGHLQMSTWHSCDTTHCRAGWAIHLAGEAGYALERDHGSQRAGSMIYRASTGRVPWFFDPSNEHALEDIRRCAAAAAVETAVPPAAP